jgi:GNAT superfamily N-acetyltransferase
VGSPTTLHLRPKAVIRVFLPVLGGAAAGRHLQVTTTGRMPTVEPVTGLEIRPLDVDDEDELRSFHEVGRRSELEDGRPWNGFWPYGDLAARLREPAGDRRTTGWCAFEDGRLVGVGLVELSLLDNLDKGWVFVAVDPDARRRGVGGSLVEVLVDQVREDGRREVLAEAAIPVEDRNGSGTLRFAGRHGFAQANLEVVRMLRLPVRDGFLEEMAAEAAPHHDGYTVESHVDELPDRYLESYCHLLNQLGADAPTGDVDFEEERVTPDVLRQKMARNRRAGRHSLYSLAVRDGEAVAHSDLFTTAGSQRAYQMGTLVRRDHRGHRLGTAVKVANLMSLVADRPDVTEVHTQNAETNEWMVSINVRLGFQRVGLAPAFVRRL